MMIVHYVYKITNLINGNYYIGKHSADKIDDGYLGSGTLLMRAIKRYGVANFKKEIIQFCDTSKDAYDIESKLVTMAQVNDRACYNLVVGGNGAGSGEGNLNYGRTGDNHPLYKKTPSDETKRRLSDAHKGRHTGPDNCMFGRRDSEVHNARTVCKIDVNTGDVLSKYSSCASAEEEMCGKRDNVNNISRCARGERRVAYGYNWEYINN